MQDDSDCDGAENGYGVSAEKCCQNVGVLPGSTCCGETFRLEAVLKPFLSFVHAFHPGIERSPRKLPASFKIATSQMQRHACTPNKFRQAGIQAFPHFRYSAASDKQGICAGIRHHLAHGTAVRCGAGDAGEISHYTKFLLMAGRTPKPSLRPRLCSR